MTPEERLAAAYADFGYGGNGAARLNADAVRRAAEAARERMREHIAERLAEKQRDMHRQCTIHRIGVTDMDTGRVLDATLEGPGHDT